MKPSRLLARLARPCLARPGTVVACALLLVSCATFPGHPVRLSAPRLETAASSGDPGALDEPGAPSAEQRVANLFGGLEALRARVLTMHATPLPTGRAPRFVRFPEIVASVKRRYGRQGFGGPVRTVVVLGVTGRVPLSTSAMADRLMDSEVERAALYATSFKRTQVIYAFGDARREQSRAELLGVGMGPIRFNLRFNPVTERLDLPDGRVWMRYDPATTPKIERVTLYRGSALLEPLAGGGARLTEILILGTNIVIPAFLEPPLMKLAAETLENRATNLWAGAWEGVPEAGAPEGAGQGGK